MMNLYELINCIAYHQQVYIFETNDYDQNVLIYKGRLREAIDDDWLAGEGTYNVLMNEVDAIKTAGENFIIIVKNKNFEKKLEELYSKTYVEKWKRSDKSTRPFLFSFEINELIRELRGR